MLGHRQLEFVDYVSMLKRRAWMVAVPLIIFPIVAVLISTTLQPRYLSQTLVLIDQQKIPDEYVRSVVSQDLDSRLSSMKEQILSRSRIQPIIERYSLYSSTHLSLDDKIDVARKNISIKGISSEMARGGGVPGFFISFTANDPRTAQAVCGDITSLFVNEDLRSREASAEGTTDFLKGQLEDAKRSLDEQDAKLAAFQRQFVGKLPGEESPNVDMLTSLNTQLEAANQSLSRMEQDDTYVKSMLAQFATPTTAGSSGPSVPNVQKESRQAELRTMEAQLAELSASYTNDHPDVVSARRKVADLRKQIEQMPDTVPATTLNSLSSRGDSPAVLQLRAQQRAAEAGIESKRHEQEMLQSQIRLYQDRIASSPLVDQQYKQLTRDYETAKKFYEDLLNKMNQSKMATDLERRQEGQQFKVMDQPNLPDAPIFPNRLIFVGGGLLLGLVTGLAIAAFLEYRDTSLRSERDVWAFTHLPTLATIELLHSQVAAAPSKRSLKKALKLRVPGPLAPAKE